MSNTSVLTTRADCIEKLLSERKYQDIGIQLAYLETVDMTIDDLQETDVAKAVFRIFKNCPSVVLKNKAKHLLSKWKTIYKKHYSLSVQHKLVLTDKADEDSGYPRVVFEDVHSFGKPNQYKILCSTSSNTCLPSENPPNDAGSHVQKDNTTQPNNECIQVLYEALTDPSSNEKSDMHHKILCSASSNTCLPSENPPNDAGSHVQKDSATQPALLGHSSFTSETGHQHNPNMAVRYKCIQLLYEALTDPPSNEESDMHHKIAEEIEQHVFALYATNERKYKNCIRSKVSNLKNPKNSHLKQNLYIGHLSPKAFAGMSAMEMAHEELKQLRASYTKSAVQEHQLPQGINGTHTNKIKCRRCEKFDCTVTVIARGALFLPGWVRNTNPDEQMMTYVICNECGEQWYHSSWNCL